MNRKSATFGEFKDYTLAVARGEHMVDPSEPKVWCEQIEGGEPATSAAATDANSHYIHSTLRERIVEHVFIGDALRRLWQRGVTDVEVLRSEFDAGGYDLVMSYRQVVRHIQLKTILEDGKAARVSVNLKLMEKPAGCVICIMVSSKLELKSFRWLGDAPGKPLLLNITKLKVTKYTKGNAKGTKLERPNHRVVPLKRFEPPVPLDTVLELLFGPLP